MAFIHFCKKIISCLWKWANIKKKRFLLENIQGIIVQHMLPKVHVSLLKNMSDDIHNMKIMLYNIA
jgi:hypothetical protein